MPGIRLELERSGGFGGLALPPRVLDAADLPPEERAELAGLVATAERAPRRVSPVPQVPDAMRYDLTIHDAGRVRRLTFDDVTMPPEVRELVTRIVAEGRER